jgi:hypothetical protein
MEQVRQIKRSDIPNTDILNACMECHQEWHNGNYGYPSPELLLADKYPPKVSLAKMEQLIGKGYLEYGISIRTSWVTEKGMELLRTTLVGAV